jgi:hypothetical protein
MSRLFPHTSYAEDQPLARSLLTFHVLCRGLNTGGVIGTAILAAEGVTSRLRTRPAAAVALPPPPPLLHRYLRRCGTSTAATLGLVSIALTARMWGRSEIEWKDRSWRLLENKAQVELDDFTVGGAAAGVGAFVAAMPRAARSSLGWRGYIGSAGAGSMLGMVLYLAGTTLLRGKAQKSEE